MIDKATKARSLDDKKAHQRQEVSGHDFSRAERHRKKRMGL